MALRAPHLYQSLRGFCLAAFAVERGAELPFAFEEHPTRGGPSLYEYRPLVRGFVEEQAPSLRRLPDARNAIDDLRREPAAAIFAHAHSGVGSTEDDALFRTILLPLLSAVAERCGGFDWSDDAFDVARTPRSSCRSSARRGRTPRSRRSIGLSAGATVELGGGIRVRAAVAGEVASLWPEAHGLMPPEFGRDVDRLCVLELSRELDADEAEPPDAAGELADAVSALRLATAGAIAAGPVVFERLDFRPLRISPLLPIAATQPHGEAIRLDALRGTARRRSARAAPARRRRSRARRGARSLGAVALRRGAVPFGPAARRAHGAARRRRRRVGRRRCARRCCSARRRRSAPSCSRRCAPSTSGARRVTRSAARSSRRSCTATAPTSCSTLDQTLLGLRPRPATVLAA